MKIKGNLKVSGTTEGITFTDGTTTYARNSQLTFGSDFYLGGDGSGHPKLLLKNPVSGIVFTDGDSNSYSAATQFSASNLGFYLSRGSVGQPVINLKNGFLRTLSLEFPGAAENAFMFRAPRAMRILNAHAVLVGSATPSVTFSVKSGTDRSSLGTTNTTSQAVTSTTTGTGLVVSTPDIAAGAWVCLVSTAQSGTVTELDLNMECEWA